MANGKIVTGLSNLTAAVWDGDGTYSGATPLMRAVSIDITPNEATENPFYADNVIAENVVGMVKDGTIKMVGDGLLDATRKLITGTGAAVSNWYSFADTDTAPYLGIGFIVRTMSAGVTKYTAVVLAKVKITSISDKAETAEKEIKWQTCEIEGTFYSDDIASGVWKWMSEEQTTLAAAKTLLDAKLA